MINPIDEGYIKFNADHTFKAINIPYEIFNCLTEWRIRLFDLNLIGETPEGIGFGNISIKYENGFFITGSATGSKRELEKEGYAYIQDYDFNKNKVISIGKTIASSESMSHAAVYEYDEKIKAVIHVHSSKIWNKYVDVLPTTSKEISFGTPKMAFDIQRLLKKPENYKKGIIIMGGHEDGVISFGESINEAGERVLKLLD